MSDLIDISGASKYLLSQGETDNLELKVQYTFGVPGNPGTNFIKNYDLDEIEQGYPQEELCNEPLMKDYRRIDRTIILSTKD